MSHHYKRYSLNQLQAEEKDLKERLAEAESLDQKNYIAIYNRKIEIVQSYMLDQGQFHAGDIREYKENSNYLFEIDEMSGVIAWGYRIDKNTHERIDRGKPIAKLLILLGKKV